MSHSHNTLPLGELLQKSGLISNEQLQQALNFQAQYTNIKLGEILVLQEIILPQTVDFFVNRWQNVIQTGQQYPLGYYLAQAYLLTQKQIKTILQEQENNQLKFGELVVEKGWLPQKTIDFFIANLASTPPQLMSLIDLEKYNQNTIHLERKYSNASLIFSRILAWTGGNPILTKNIYHVFAQSDLNIPAGEEIRVVDRLIKNYLIKNWHTSKLGKYLRYLQEKLINNQRCQPLLLLNKYQEILLTDSHRDRQTTEERELLTLGLIVRDKDNLRVTNIIYQQVFNRHWLAKAKQSLQSSGSATRLSENSDSIAINPTKQPITENKPFSSSITPLPPSRLDVSPEETDTAETIKATEPLAKFSALITLGAIALVIPLVLTINNYYSGTQQQSNVTNNASPQADSLQKFCNQIDLGDSTSALGLLYRLEKNKQDTLRSFPRTLQTFPDNCEVILNKLRILAVPQLGKQSRVIEAIKHLCKIPADSESINEAKVWIERWYTSQSWGQETQSYLSLVNDCPAGNFN